MTDKEFWLYVIFILWVLANWGIYILTKNDVEFYDPKTGKGYTGWKLFYYASFGTIPARIRLWWSERK